MGFKLKRANGEILRSLAMKERWFSVAQKMASYIMIIGLYDLAIDVERPTNIKRDVGRHCDTVHCKRLFERLTA